MLTFYELGFVLLLYHMSSFYDTKLVFGIFLVHVLCLGNVRFILIAVKSAEFYFHMFCSFRVSIIYPVRFFFSLTIRGLKFILF